MLLRVLHMTTRGRRCSACLGWARKSPSASYSSGSAIVRRFRSTCGSTGLWSDGTPRVDPARLGRSGRGRATGSVRWPATRSNTYLRAPGCWRGRGTAVHSRNSRPKPGVAECEMEVRQMRGRRVATWSLLALVGMGWGLPLTAGAAPADTRIIRRATVQLTDIKPNDFVAVTPRREPDGTLTALLINIFPPEFKGRVREAQFVMDSGNMMTNAVVFQN